MVYDKTHHLIKKRKKNFYQTLTKIIFGSLKVSDNLTNNYSYLIKPNLKIFNIRNRGVHSHYRFSGIWVSSNNQKIIRKL